METEKKMKSFKHGLNILITQLVIILLFFATLVLGQPVVATESGATTSIRVAKYADDNRTVLAENNLDFKWLEDNLPVCGDGITHYYHQGPVFEGDIWDPEELINLKDKGAVRGTDIKDICELVGGMASGDEVIVCSVDGYRVKFAYTNVYNPMSRQGPIVLCWYKGKDAAEGMSYEYGYPGKDAYSSALQLVFMAGTKNPEGKFVFGNDDMRVCLPEEKYQHYYEGLPSTNGLSAKWVSEIRIYTKGAPDNIEIDNFSAPNEASNGSIPWLPIILGSLGLVLIIWSLYFFVWKRR